MDLDYHFGEKIVITPKNYPLTLKHEKTQNNHYAIIGMAAVQKNYPLYADAMNERGLCISALNFPGNAYYNPKPTNDKLNLTSYEIIPYIMSKCASVSEARSALDKIQIVNTPFDENTGASPLHWHIADNESSVTVESTKNGLKIYDNPVGILTNNPEFPSHLQNLSNYEHLKPASPTESAYSLGLSTYGLPGDFSSPSRFVRLAFLKKYMDNNLDESTALATAFQVMSSVSVVKGTVLTKEQKPHYTIYTCVMSATNGIYRYTTHKSTEIKSVNLNKYNLFSDTLYSLEL